MILGPFLVSTAGRHDGLRVIDVLWTHLVWMVHYKIAGKHAVVVVTSSHVLKAKALFREEPAIGLLLLLMEKL